MPAPDEGDAVVVMDVIGFLLGSISPGLCMDIASASSACCSGVISLNVFDGPPGVGMNDRRCSTLAGAGMLVKGTGPVALGAFGSFELDWGVLGAMLNKGRMWDVTQPVNK